jgi:hypothetical protein
MTMNIVSKRYRLKDGSIYWHKLYYDIMPRFLTRYSPPLGDYNYAHYLYQPHKYVQELYLAAKWFMQRGYRGYSDRDVWSIDFYLNSWMPKALEQLKRTTRGHPIGMSEKAWDLKLDRMIRAFETAKAIEGYEYLTPEKYRVALRQFRKDFDVFKNHYFSLWD